MGVQKVTKRRPLPSPIQKTDNDNYQGSLLLIVTHLTSLYPCHFPGRLPTRGSINSSSSGSLQRRLVSVVTGSCCMLSLPSPQQRPAMNANSLSSLHGLTFGGRRRRMKKPAGLEDASSLMASTAAAAAAEKKEKGGAVHQQPPPPPPPPRCQVEGCDVDLTGMKAYYCRHKVCGAHSKAPLVVVAGIQQRFCQQCSRFHQLHEFDQGKRSCRRRLACHNERRRKLPPAPPTSHTGHMLSALQARAGGTRHCNKFSGFLVDFTQTKPPALSQHSLQRGPVRDDSHRYHSGSPGAPSAKMVNHGAFPFLQEFPPAGSQPLTGGSDSSCALSLLSTQPWDSSKATHGGISATAGGAPTAEHAYTASSWSCKALEGSSSSSRTSFEARLNQVGEDDGSGSHFAGELELVLQGKRHCVGLELSRRFRDSDDGIHWSL